jgi:hypothetical protein
MGADGIGLAREPAELFQALGVVSVPAVPLPPVGA